MKQDKKAAERKTIILEKGREGVLTEIALTES
jgi:hypothetical protein